MQVARDRSWEIFACNDAYKLAPDAALLFACNSQWWDRRWPEVWDLSAAKWTSRPDSAARYGINYIREKDAPGLSQDPSVIHHGHSSGYQLLGMAYRAGAERILLLGYDLAFAPDYDGRARIIGSSPRHFFGEYEPELQHWPSVMVQQGRHVELLELYHSVARQGLVEIINCTEGGVLDAFPRMSITDVD